LRDIILNAQILFIADVHLALEKTELTRHFLEFLQQRAPQAQAVYILGDLFDSWIGDDDNTPPNPTIKAALKRLTDSGTAVYLLQGNRDFLLGQRFCRETGVRMLGDYARIELGRQPVLLTHGDLLCSDDLAYQAFRVKSRSAEWQQSVLGKPLWLRLLAARWYRLRSFFHKRKKSQEIMDVNQHSVQDALRQHDCRILIHGHTHRPAKHDLQIDDRPASRWVLAEWKKDDVRILCWDGVRLTFETLV
jgi:UDP-2,3-diacylglucosamine hydrolase